MSPTQNEWNRFDDKLDKLAEGQHHNRILLEKHLTFCKTRCEKYESDQIITDKRFTALHDKVKAFKDDFVTFPEMSFVHKILVAILIITVAGILTYTIWGALKHAV